MTDPLVLTLAAVGLACAFVMLLGWRKGRRLDRRYEEADIRLVGGPFEGEQVDRYHGGDRWPPREELLYYRVDEKQYRESVYRLDADGAWRFEEERSWPAPPERPLYDDFGWGGP